MADPFKVCNDLAAAGIKLSEYADFLSERAKEMYAQTDKEKPNFLGCVLNPIGCFTYADKLERANDLQIEANRFSQSATDYIKRSTDCINNIASGLDAVFEGNDVIEKP